MFVKCFREYCNFVGRATRKEYWTYSIISGVIISILLGCMAPVFIMALNAGMISDQITEDQLTRYFISSPCFLLIMSLYMAVILFQYPILAVSVRRLHDVGKSAWWLLINLIPLVGQIWFIILMLLKGENDSNQWGENPRLKSPKEINQIEKSGFYYKKTIKNYFNFKGITSLEEYYGFGWVCSIIILVLSVLCFLIGFVCFGFNFTLSQNWMLTSCAYILILILWGLFLLIPSIALCIRRLRDANYSPWFILILLVGNIGQCIITVMLCQPSTIKNYDKNIN